MAAISSSTSQTATTLAQALAKLAADEAAQASAKTISADEATVAQFERRKLRRLPLSTFRRRASTE